MADRHYFDIEWRFSGTQPLFYGLDPVFVLFFPLFLFGLAQEMGFIYFGLVFGFALTVIYVSYFTAYPRVVDWVNAQRIRYFQRCEWPT